MTASIQDIVDTLTTTIKAITPTRTREGYGFTTRSEDSIELEDQPAVSGADRSFQVRLLRRRYPDNGYWMPGERQVIADYEVKVFYIRTGDLEDDLTKIYSDTDDIAKAVNDVANRNANSQHTQTLDISGPEEDKEKNLWIQTIPVEIAYIQEEF